MQTRLTENFGVGVTDFALNPVCLSRAGDPQALPTVTNPAQCAARGFVANPDFNPVFIPLDLTRGGSLLQFAGSGNVNEYAFYLQDTVTVGNATLNAGVRASRYDGVGGVKDTQAEPRVG